MLKPYLVIGTLFLSTSVLASGYQLTEYSTVGVGRSFAGAGVVGDDYSAVSYNPAGIKLPRTNGIQLGASTVGIRSSVTGTSVTGESGKTRPYIVRVLPQVYAQYHLTDKLSTAFGIYTPFGLATDYKNCWFGKHEALRSEIKAVNIGPGLAYQLTPWLTIGASVNLQYASANLTNQHPSLGKATLEGDDLGVNYVLGMMVEPTSTTRLGLSWRSKVTHKLKGDLSFTRSSAYDQDIYAKITTPEMVILSGYQQLNDKWGLSGTVKWTRWQQFKELDIYTQNHQLVSSTSEHWRNTWFYSLGADYKYTDKITLRFGSAYDQSTVNSTYRTARIPDGRRIWASFGASYQTGAWEFDAGFAHLFIKKVTARNAGNVGGTMQKTHLRYGSSANIFSLSARYTF